MDSKLLKDFEKLKFGDIIYANRPGVNKQSDPFGYHSSSPYIVISNNKDALTALKCTTRYGKNRVGLEGEYEALSRGGFVIFDVPEVIDKELFLYSYNSSLNEIDKQKIRKYIKVRKI